MNVWLDAAVSQAVASETIERQDLGVKVYHTEHARAG